MLPEPVRRRVDAMWDRIWASGVSNPLTAVEYVSTVLLLRRLAETHPAASEWAEVREHVAAGSAGAVARTMVRVQSAFGIGASPEASAASTWSDLATLDHVLREVAALEIGDRNHDILGDVFEHVLNHLSTAGRFGQFRTPRHVIQLLVAAVDPQPGEVVLDPAAGTAGFLIAAHEHRRGAAGAYVGHEVDATVARVARTNLLLHGIGSGQVHHGDSLAVTTRDADVVLANPPFAGTVAPERVREYESGTTRTELLFLELTMRRLVPGGRAGVVVPTNVLTATGHAPTWIRSRLLESNRLRAVVELPAGVFRPYTDVRTALLLWSNDAPADDVLLVRVDADGYTLDDKRRPTDRDDLPGALALIRGGTSSVPHARVPRDELRRSGYNLGPSRYIPLDAPAPPTAPGGPTGADLLLRARAATAALEAEIGAFARLLR